MIPWVLAALVTLMPWAARGEEPLWTEGPSRSALPANAPINMQSFVRLARTLGPAVVNVVAIQNGDIGDETPGAGGDRPHGHGRGQGTGFIIHKSGYILTNAHVIEGADDIRVRLVDERELSARLIGKDEHTDIALLKIEAGTDLPVAPLGNSDDVQIGEWVMATMLTIAGASVRARRTNDCMLMGAFCGRAPRDGTSVHSCSSARSDREENGPAASSTTSGQDLTA